MKEIITKDGSITFRNEKYDETYHSVSGAEEEAIKKHALPCINHIKSKPENIKTVKILDVCFGLGYNSAAAIDELKKIEPNIKINMIALENDKKILNKISKINSNFKFFDIIREAAKNLYYKDNNVELRIILGDGIKEIKNLEERFDIIFHDPFSKDKMPPFWTEEFFKAEFQLLKNGGCLSTYSCAKSVRENMQKAGFKTIDVPPVGRRAPSTLAIKE
jgi:tRNA U34 5-methylaminomethyl-2-thiouridine-forming methyltransferase MnmC